MVERKAKRPRFSLNELASFFDFDERNVTLFLHSRENACGLAAENGRRGGSEPYGSLKYVVNLYYLGLWVGLPHDYLWVRFYFSRAPHYLRYSR